MDLGFTADWLCGDIVLLGAFCVLGRGEGQVARWRRLGGREEADIGGDSSFHPLFQYPLSEGLGEQTFRNMPWRCICPPQACVCTDTLTHAQTHTTHTTHTQTHTYLASRLLCCFISIQYHIPP